MWMILVLCVFFVVFYFFVGVVKFYLEWFDGMVLLIFMQDVGMLLGLFGV